MKRLGVVMGFAAMVLWALFSLPACTGGPDDTGDGGADGSAAVDGG